MPVQKKNKNSHNDVAFACVAWCGVMYVTFMFQSNHHSDECRYSIVICVYNHSFIKIQKEIIRSFAIVFGSYLCTFDVIFNVFALTLDKNGCAIMFDANILA